MKKTAYLILCLLIAAIVSGCSGLMSEKDVSGCLSSEPQKIDTIEIELDRQFIFNSQSYASIDEVIKVLKAQNIPQVVLQSKVKLMGNDSDEIINCFVQADIKIREFWVPVSVFAENGATPGMLDLISTAPVHKMPIGVIKMPIGVIIMENRPNVQQ